MSETVTKEANAAVQKVIEDKQPPGATPDKSVSIHISRLNKRAKYATECGSASAVRNFKNEFLTLGKSTVRLFKKQPRSKELVTANRFLTLEERKTFCAWRA